MNKTQNPYADESKFLVAVDCVIFGFEADCVQVLFQRRNLEPHLGEFTPLGGFVKENETLDDAANRILKERTGMDNVYMSQVHTFSALDRDPGARVLSTVYFALIDKHRYDSAFLQKYKCQWFDIDKLPELYFDHEDMVDKSLRMLRDRIGYTPVAMQLLPQEFTLTRVQKIYESILAQKLDKRNFRKKIAGMPYFVKTEKMDRNGARRAAALYRFDYGMYNEKKNFNL